MLRTTLAALAALTLISSAAARPSDAEITTMTLQQMKAAYEADQSQFEDYDAWLRCTRSCWNTATDCQINEGTGCNQYYADCMDACNAAYRDN